MDPLRLLPATPPEAGEHATPQPRDGAARWRQELERAQWALRTQRAAVASGPAGRGEPATCPPAPARSPAPPPAQRAEVSPPASLGRPAGPPSSASTP